MMLTDALRGEHAVLYALFAHVGETIRKTDDPRALDGAVSVLERLLGSHAQVEEDLLFPRLEPHLGEAGPLAVMRAEHERIDGFLAAAKRTDDPAALKSVISQLLQLAYMHFRKEESVLFQIAERFLSPAMLTEMGDRWAERRDVVLEGGRGCGLAS